jgi:dihydroorotase/allantoinase
MMLNEVNKGSFTLEQFVEVTSENASKIFGFYPQKGTIQVGSDADVILVDLDREWTITSDRVYTKCQLNPFHDWKIRGKVTHTILRGQVIMEEGEVMGKPGYGTFIKPCF